MHFLPFEQIFARIIYIRFHGFIDIDYMLGQLT
jgi:hypothetical protein